MATISAAPSYLPLVRAPAASRLGWSARELSLRGPGRQVHWLAHLGHHEGGQGDRWHSERVLTLALLGLSAEPSTLGLGALSRADALQPLVGAGTPVLELQTQV